MGTPRVNPGIRMTVTLAMLVLNPPLDRMAALIEYMRPVVSETVVVVDDRTSIEALDRGLRHDGRVARRPARAVPMG
jgi:hypothetical protein